MLCGLNQAAFHPTGGENPVGNLRLLKSRFGSGWLLDGSHPRIKAGTVKLNKAVHLLKTCSLGPHVWQDEKVPELGNQKVNLVKIPDTLENESDNAGGDDEDDTTPKLMTLKVMPKLTLLRKNVLTMMMTKMM